MSLSLHLGVFPPFQPLGVNRNRQTICLNQWAFVNVSLWRFSIDGSPICSVDWVVAFMKVAVRQAAVLELLHLSAGGPRARGGPRTCI